jgi:hypothetical protein
MNPNQEKSILDHWNSFFVTLQKATSNPAIPLAITGTGIFNAWQSLYLKGTQLGPASSYEYDSVDWNGNPLKCQDFGSYRIEYVFATGVFHVFGPTGQVV